MAITKVTSSVLDVDIPAYKSFGTSSIMIGDTTTGTIDAANYNTGVGVDVFAALTQGDANTAIGFAAGTAITTGIRNSLLGYNAGVAITTGTQNTFVGKDAGAANTTASSNTFIGERAGLANTTGDLSVAVGQFSLGTNTTGASNVAIGRSALSANTTASNNTAVGTSALSANTTGAGNTSMGYSSGSGTTTGNNNVSIGKESFVANTTGTENVVIGLLAGRYVNANYNTFLGSRAGYTTTSSENVMIGAYGGSSNTSSYHHVIIGYNAQSNNASSSNTENVIGHGVTGIGSGYTTLGGNANRTYNQQGSSSWSGTSDERLKTDVVNEPLGLSFINDLRPVKFKWKKKKDVDSSTFPTIYEEGSEERVQPTEHGVDKHGFLAQELESTIANYADAGDAGHEIFKQTTDGIYTASPSALIPMLVKALQEADSKIDALTTRIEALEN